MNEDSCVIMPVYNEAKVVRGVIDNLAKQFEHIVCVDDGSQDGSDREIAKTNATLLRHTINSGQGAALQTGIEYAKRHISGVEYFVTFDSDGQHRIEDALVMVNKLRTGKHDVVLGSRFIKKQQDLPLSKKILLKGAIKFTNALSGIELTDTHNGLRAFNSKFAKILSIKMADMSHANEIIDTISNSKMRWCEVPVKINYTDYSRSKGQSLFNSINIAFDVLLSKVLS